ncbi:MAG: NAD(P)H-hydrate dehydratase [Allosphingosinicella sp.]
MTPRAIFTAAEIRAAEEAAIAAGTSVEALMDRAGSAAAEAVWRHAGPLPALVLCGPGNNGGDGYVLARRLAERGVTVRVAALGEPGTSAAKAARQEWQGEVEPLETAGPSVLLVDALFGTGLKRPLDALAAGALGRLASGAQVRVALDLPSGVATDDGRILSPVPDFDLTVAFGALKPSHLLQPAARHMGRLVVADIGLAGESRLAEIGRPRLRRPGPDDYKYSRGYAAMLAGEMPGASALTAAAAARGGAGYVRLIAGETLASLPAAIVQSRREPELSLEDERIGALAVGPGLGRDRRARTRLQIALASKRPLVLDADALVLIAERGPPLDLAETPILTPHAGEFARLWTGGEGSKIEEARAAAAAWRAVIVFKGPDTIVAAPDGRAAIARVPHSLASAGTGDVLTGVIAAMRAAGLEPFEAACAAIWLHARAAELAGPTLIADDLLRWLPAALAECQ